MVLGSGLGEGGRFGRGEARGGCHTLRPIAIRSFESLRIMPAYTPLKVTVAEVGNVSGNFPSKVAKGLRVWSRIMHAARARTSTTGSSSGEMPLMIPDASWVG